MPKIEKEQLVNGFKEKTERLGLTPLINEVKTIITDFNLLIKEEKDTNGAKVIREIIDERFERRGEWIKKQTGDVDWTKCKIINGTRVCVGVEIQLSARSDLVTRDFIHLRNAMIAGSIDVGIIVVPSDRMSVYLTDRVANFSTTIKYVHELRVEDLPFLIIAIEHDGPGTALIKHEKNPKKRG